MAYRTGCGLGVIEFDSDVGGMGDSPPEKVTF